MTLYKNIYVQWGIVGLLLGVGFLQSVVWPLGLLGIGYFLYLLLDAEHSVKSKLLGSLLSWTIKYLCALFWFWTSYPIDWLAVELGKIQIVLIFTYWFTASLWLGMGGVFFVGVVLLLKRFGSLKNNHLYILVPLLWVASEIMGSLIFSVITYGPGSEVTAAFSFGYVGYLLGNHEILMQVARLGGVYALTICTVALVLPFIVSAKLRENRAVLLGAIILLYVSSFITLGTRSLVDGDSYHVVTIDTSFPVDELRSRGSGPVDSSLGEAVAAALSFEPAYIILPEDSRFFDQSSPVGTTKARFQLQFNDPQVVLIDSGRYNPPGVAGSVLQTYIYNGDHTVGRVQKRYLVPQGEYMPTLYTSTLSLFGYDHLVERVGESISFRVGLESDQSVLATEVPGVLFCFESVNPIGVRTILREKNDMPFVAHPISHAWFHEPTQLWDQLDTMLRIQAIWNQQYIVSAGGHVAGALYTPEGSIMSPTTIASGDYWTVREVYIPK